MVTFVVVSFIAGVSSHHSWLRRLPLAYAAASGALLGLGCSAVWLAFLWLTQGASNPSVDVLLYPFSWFLAFGLPFMAGRVALKSIERRLSFT